MKHNNAARIAAEESSRNQARQAQLALAKLNNTLASENQQKTEKVEELVYRAESVAMGAHDVLKQSFLLEALVHRALTLAEQPEQKALLEKLTLCLREVDNMGEELQHQAQVNTALIAPTQTMVDSAQLVQGFFVRYFDFANQHAIMLAGNCQSHRVLCNEPLVRRIIGNLLNNAILYSPPDTIVTIRTSRNASHCFFWVRDNGPGLSDADSPDREGNFARLVARIAAQNHDVISNPACNPLNQRMHGLGLRSVQRLCDEIGTTMLLRSRPRGGSVFCFKLPLAAPQPKRRKR